MIYFTSDWHIGHKNVLAFDERPFDNLDHMHRVLINNFNSTVHQGDTCYFLGDVGLGRQEVLEPIVRSLNGIKVLILGNHDKGAAAMKRMGFDIVLNGAVLWIAGHRVTMSHCPQEQVWREDVTGMRGAVAGESWHGEKRHTLRYSMPFQDAAFHLHGHIHSRPIDRILGKQFDVGVRANAWRPVSMSVIESWIAKYGR
jgi:calcineurin-like phosphoesterase family protein